MWAPLDVVAIRLVAHRVEEDELDRQQHASPLDAGRGRQEGVELLQVQRREEQQDGEGALRVQRDIAPALLLSFFFLLKCRGRRLTQDIQIARKSNFVNSCP